MSRHFTNTFLECMLKKETSAIKSHKIGNEAYASLNINTDHGPDFQSSLKMLYITSVTVDFA